MRALLALIAVLGGMSLITACQDTDAAALYVAVDTLPGGIVRTMTSQPIDSGHWQLVRARDIQPPELDSAELFNPQDVAIADDGSVIVADLPAQIKVFDPSGRHLRTFGRNGSGPGEFRTAYIAVRGDTLVVQDPRNARATTFNWQTGAMLGERRTACCYFSPIGIDGQGRAVVRTIGRAPDSTWRNAQGFVRFPLSGASADTVFARERDDLAPVRPWVIREGNRMLMSVPPPLQPRLHFEVDPLGGFITGHSSDYTLRVTSDGLDTVALFGRSWNAAAVSAAEKQRLVDARIAVMREQDRSGPSEAALRAAFDPTLIPDTRPAYENLRVDASGRRWVRRTETDTTQTRFDLFGADGRWLDVVSLPASDWPRSPWAPAAWGRDEVAVILEGDDARPLVRVYAIVRRSDL